MISALSTSELRLASLAKDRASFYAFLNLHFMELPDEEFAGALRKEEFSVVLKELEQSAGNHAEMVEGASLMQAFLVEARALDDRQFAEKLGVDRTRLYRGGSPNEGPTPPYESLWTGKDQDSMLLMEIAGIYRESGFALRKDIHERLDYLGIQLNYMERLVLREVTAREAGDKEEIRMILTREKEFIREHLGKWVPGFVLSALAHARTDFYRGHLHMLKGFVEQEKEMLPLNESMRLY